MNGQKRRWFPFTEVKSGQILSMSDFVDKLGNDSRGLPSALTNKNSTLDPSRKNKNDPSPLNNKYDSPDSSSGVPGRFHIIRANDPIKTDLVGKSDPYAVILKGGDSNGFGSRKSSSDSPRDNVLNSNLPNGKVKLNLIKAKDLIKADLIGKSDPYAILKYGKQLQKTKTIKNTLEPQWNHEAVVELLEEYMTK